MASAAAVEEAPRSDTLLRKHIRQLTKTEMCKFFMSNRCGKGTRCTYAHSITEIRSKPDLEKTSMCKQFLQTGNCNRPGCTFAHDERELRTTTEFFKTKMCRFAASGRCKHGFQCRFAHSFSELAPHYRAAAEAEAAAAERARQESRDSNGAGLFSPDDEAGDVVPPPAQWTEQPGEQVGNAAGTSEWGDMTIGWSDQGTQDAASSDQSTRAETSASVPTPEGSGDSGQEEGSNSPSFQMPRNRGSGNEATSQRRTERQRAGGAPTRYCTTMMLTNVPEFLTQGALVSLLEDLTICIRGAFDFFYCPWDSSQDKNLGYAIINFFSRSVAAEFEREWSNNPLLPRTHGTKRLRIVPAALQGRAANLRHFSGFSLAHHTDPRFRPLVRAAPNEVLRPMAISEELVEATQRQQAQQQHQQQQQHNQQQQQRPQQQQQRPQPQQQQRPQQQQHPQQQQQQQQQQQYHLIQMQRGGGYADAPRSQKDAGQWPTEQAGPLRGQQRQAARSDLAGGQSGGWGNSTCSAEEQVTNLARGMQPMGVGLGVGGLGNVLGAGNLLSSLAAGDFAQMLRHAVGADLRNHQPFVFMPSPGEHDAAGLMYEAAMPRHAPEQLQASVRVAEQLQGWAMGGSESATSSNAY